MSMLIVILLRYLYIFTMRAWFCIFYKWESFTQFAVANAFIYPKVDPKLEINCIIGQINTYTM